MQASQLHRGQHMSKRLCYQPLQGVDAYCVSQFQTLGRQLYTNAGNERAQFNLQDISDRYCTLESSSGSHGYATRSSTSTVTFSSNGSPADQHNSPDNTYGSPVSGSCITDDISDFRHKLLELETVMLGPDSDIIDSFDSFYQEGTENSEVGSWGQVMDAITKGNLKKILIACAKAVSDNDALMAQWLMDELRKMVSVRGEPMQRLGAYMLEGLVARSAFSGSSIYKSLRCKEPASMELLSYMHVLYDVCPYFKFGYMSANGAIAEAMKDEDRVHIIDFQISQGTQWITLIQAFAGRPGGPPHIRITGIDDPASAHARRGGLDIVGMRLSKLAKLFNVPFEFHSAAISGCDVQQKDLGIRRGEALAVNFAFMLHHMPDESVSTENHRDRLLRLVKGLSPKVVTLVEQESNTNTAAFFPRFIETLDYYNAMFESIDVTLPRQHKERINIEQHCLAREVVNILACEGAERVERHELLGKWRLRFSMAGFTPYPLSSLVNATIKTLLDNYSNRYRLEEKEGALYLGWMDRDLLPPGTNIPEAYAHGSSEEQAFIQNLALFFTSFYKSHIRVLESTQESVSALLMGLEYLINISYVDDNEVFKVCLDYWNSLVLELFEAHHNMDNPAVSANMMGLQVPLISGVVDGLGSQLMQRRQLYSGPMSKLRMLMICRMAKPEEVLIVEDENGNIVRETLKDNDVLVQYKSMRETLIYLSHLDHDDTEKMMLKKLSRQLSGEDWSWNNLNTLCWAIGSISGSMMEDQENRFLVMVIRDLLNLCEITKGKDNKAVIASNIMYVVGQYPRFLRAHWKFLKTVVNKLFEFMHETHPGVQDMACDTFLKIVQKCKRKFVIVQVGENEPFVSELLSSLPTTVVDLEPHQIHAFYESVGNMIQAEPDPQKRDEYLQRLMELPNQKWGEIIGQARQSVDFLKDQDVIRTVLNILQTNTSVASSLGTYFLPQISLIFLDMLNVYRMYSELISSSIAEGGPYASKTSYVKLLRSVKRETLKLIETFLDKAEDQPQIGKQFVPPMMEPILLDYARNLPDARESEVLSLFATIINKYKNTMIEDVPRIFEAVFQCTLEMITKNFEDYPEHRLKFFSLLRAIATYCFPALIRLSSQQLKLVMDSIIWAFRHTERNIAETGLNLLLEMLKNFQASEFCNQFYRTYFLTIEQEIFAVLTDTFHKPGFKLHVLVLQHLSCLAESGVLTEPLWDVATVTYPYQNNVAFVREYTIKLLSSSFPNMTAAEVTQFVNGLFDSRNDLSVFKDHIRDFLVQSKEFSAQDNKDLYAEEAAAQRERDRQRMLSIPGLIAPNEIQDEMVDS